MRCPIVVGRDEELATLDGLLADAIHGRGEMIALVGEAGIGKTRLVEHAVDRATAFGMATMLGRAAPADLPLRPIAEMLLDATRGCEPPLGDADLAPYLAVVGTLVPHWLPPGVEPRADNPVVMAEAVLRTIVSLASDRGAAVFVEDLHWADDESRLVVAYLADRIEDRSVALVVTARDDEGSRQCFPASTRRLELNLLTSEEVAAMVAACVPDDTTIDIGLLTERSAGVPLLVEDVLSAGEDPGRFPAIVESRLHSLSPADRGVVELAAVSGFDLDPIRISDALGWSMERTAAACDQGVSAGLLRDDGARLSFRHALTREAVLAAIPSARFRDHSAVVARAVAARADNSSRELAEAAGHLSSAGETSRAAELFDQAGQAAVNEGRLDVAEAALTRACQLRDDDPSRAMKNWLALATVRLELGHASRATDAALAALERAEGRDHRVAARARTALARAAILRADWDGAGAHLVAVRRSVRASPRLGAELALLEARIALGGPTGNRAEASHLASAAVGQAREAVAADIECEARLVAGLAARTIDLDASVAMLELALSLAERDSLSRLRLEILNELGASELLRDATSDRLERALAEAERAGAVGLSASIRVNLAAVHLMTARFDHAVREADQVEATASMLGLEPLVAVSHLHRGQAAGLSGDRETMDRHLSRAEDLAPGDPDLLAASWAVGRGLNAVIEEDRDAARQAFERAAELGPDVHAAFLNPFEGPALLVKAADGEAEEAEIEAAVGRIVRGARYHELWTGAAQSSVLGRDGDSKAATAQLDVALDAGRPYPLFTAIVGRLVGEAQIRDRWGDPVALLRRSEAEFDRRRLNRASAACRTMLKVLGAPAPRHRGGAVDLHDDLLSVGVTAREADVLDLLIDRLTNKQIAERLHISPRTVEKHVASLSTKLGADRAGLAEIARRTRR